jgi:hypothetical protein
MLSTANEVICAHLESNLVDAELYLNGFPVLRVTETRPMIVESMHPFLVAGLNTMELLVAPGDVPSRAREPHEVVLQDKAWARAWLAAYPEGQVIFPDQGRRIADIHFKRFAEPSDLRLPASFHASFDLGAWRGPMAWQSAPALVLDEELRQAAFDTFRRIIEVHRDADMPALYDLFDPHLRDFVRIFGWPMADVRAQLEKAAAFYVDDPDAILPWEEKDADFRLVAYDRLIQCVSRDWMPTMRIRMPTGQILKKPIYLGLEGGALRVFR